jgi:hypothetical protein
MLKSSILLIVFISFFSSSQIIGQESNSLQFTGGIIYPMSSSKGLNGNIQFNYSLNPNVNIYIYSGYSAWNLYYVFFHEDWSPDQHRQIFKTAAEDEHSMVPVYIGSRINFHTIKLFTSFVELEVGYTYLHFNCYNILKITDPETGEVLDYLKDGTTQYKTTENLFGIGLGAGISHPITNNFNLIFEFKLNSHVNSNYYGLFSTRGTYSRFTAGFNFAM